MELLPLNHDLVHHDAKAPTCTEIGWNEYDACQREGCDYTTKVEIPAPGHDYTEKVVKPTCEKGGYTLHTCKNCQDSYKDHQTKTLLHWYGEWTSNGDGTHSATCKRKDCKHVGKTECAIVEFKQAEATRTLCPVCGNVSDSTHLALVEEVKAEGEHLPYGEPVLRMGETANGNTLLSVCFEVSGKLTQPKGEVKITLPAELPDCTHVWHIFAVRCADRNALEKHMNARGIGTNKHYPTPIHLQGAYAELGLGRGALPLAEEISATELSLPMFYGMTDAQVQAVIDAVNEFEG